MKTHLLPLLVACGLLCSLPAQEESAPIVPTEDLAPIAADVIPAPTVSADATTTRVDILIVYTPAARAYAGSASAMRAAIAAYVATANRCYANSDVALTLRLVGTAEVSYTESSSSMSTDIAWVHSDATVAALRNTYGADTVCLVRRSTVAGAAGVGYLGNGLSNFTTYAFCVVADDWADAGLTFPHEVGHNFGGNHDRGNAGNPATGYNYGWRFNGNDGVQYRTVMAYSPGIRIPYFSNPSISYQGVATGVATGGSTSADNALVLASNAAVTAAYRQAVGGVRGDFNADAKPDLLFKGADGRLCTWFMNGAARTSSSILPSTFDSATWAPVASADFDADGAPDILLVSTTGQLCLWFMNGTTRTSTSILSLTVNSAFWTPVAAADFNDDGKADILFQGTDGRLCVWFMNGATRTSSSILSLTVNPTFWVPVAAADFDGDGKADILFKGTDGRLSLWFMNGTTRTASTIVAITANLTFWVPAAAADYNGDGKADILFKGTDGRLCLWYMNGSTRTSASVLSLSVNPAAWTPF
jgi:hypothetical protein